MRIIAGKHKGRNLFTLDGPNTRPTTSRNKDSLFNIIGPYFEGGTSLDLFGGSGALTFESISRGIEEAVICDLSNDAVKIIKKNCELLKESDKVTVYKKNCFDVLDLMYKNKQSFNLIFIDPPFDMLCVDDIITKIDEYNLLKKDGIIMAEYYKANSFKEEIGSIYQYRLIDRGTSKISLYTKE